MSLLFSSHLLPDVEAVCDHVMVLGRGRLLAQGRIEELKQPHDLQFELRVKGDQAAFAEHLAARKNGFSPTMSAWIQVVPHRDCAHAGDLSHRHLVACRHGSRS